MNGLGLLGSGSPTLISPLPVLTIVPAFLFAGLFRHAALFKIVSVLPTLLFLAWNPSLLRGEAKIPKRSYVLFSTAIVLSVAYFIASWKWGIQFRRHPICTHNMRDKSRVDCLRGGRICSEFEAVILIRVKPVLTLDSLCMACLVRLPLSGGIAIIPSVKSREVAYSET